MLRGASDVRHLGRRALRAFRHACKPVCLIGPSAPDRLRLDGPTGFRC